MLMPINRARQKSCHALVMGWAIQAISEEVWATYAPQPPVHLRLHLVHRPVNSSATRHDTNPAALLTLKLTCHQAEFMMRRLKIGSALLKSALRRILQIATVEQLGLIELEVLGTAVQKQIYIVLNTCNHLVTLNAIMMPNAYDGR